jgi:hypothetical protein
MLGSFGFVRELDDECKDDIAVQALHSVLGLYRLTHLVHLMLAGHETLLSGNTWVWL